jgi:hypothetical protein
MKKIIVMDSYEKEKSTLAEKLHEQLNSDLIIFAK